MTIDTLNTSINDSNRLRIQNSLYHSNFLLPTSLLYEAPITCSHWQLKDLICKSSTSNSVYYPSHNVVNNVNFNQSPNRVGKSCIDSEEEKPLTENNNSEESSSSASRSSSSASTATNNINHKKSNTKKGTTTVVKFEDPPRCLKELDDIIVTGSLSSAGSTQRTVARMPFNASHNTAGGPTTNNRNAMKGLFGVCVKETGYIENVNVGSVINNSVSIFKTSNSRYHSFLCNNDHKLYQMNIINRSGVELGSAIKLDFALNHSSISPDLKTLVVVGDSSKICVLHPEERLADKMNRTIIHSSSDSGFSTDFNTSGLLFSVCFQAGLNQIYDLRNLNKPIYEINSTRKHNQAGAFRVCKFTKDTDDLLVISEHQSRVHLVDTRDFLTHQVIVMPKLVRDFRTGTYNQPIVKPYDELMYLGEQSSGYEVPRRLRNSTFRTRSEMFMNGMYNDAYQGFPTQPQSNSPSQEIQNDPNFYLDSEVDILGLEIMNSGYHSSNKNSSVVIGVADDSLIKWDIDSWDRRCFPSYQLA